MKCFIINLENETEKKQKMEERLHKTSLEYEFFDAVNGVPEGTLYDKTWRDPWYKRPLTEGEIGCSLSPLKSNGSGNPVNPSLKLPVAPVKPSVFKVAITLASISGTKSTIALPFDTETGPTNLIESLSLTSIGPDVINPVSPS